MNEGKPSCALGHLVIFAPITAKDLGFVCWNGQSTQACFQVPNSQRAISWKQTTDYYKQNAMILANDNM